MSDQFDGIGGSYVLDKDGNRKLVEKTIDKLEAPANSLDAPTSVAQTIAISDVIVSDTESKNLK